MEAALFLPPGSILTHIVYKHSEMPYTVFLRAVSSQGRRGHEYSYTFIREIVRLFLTSLFLTSSSVYVLTLANACNGGRRTFSTCSMHMQLGVTYHISKGASKNGLPVKYTFNECHSGENVMQCPIRCPYNGLNLMFPMGALPIEKGAVMKCPLCRPYITVSQRVSFPVGKMGCSAVRKHDECPNRCPSSG